MSVENIPSESVIDFDPQAIEVVSFDLWKTLIRTGANPNKDARFTVLYDHYGLNTGLDDFKTACRRIEKDADKLAEATGEQYGPRERTNFISEAFDLPILDDATFESFYANEAMRFAGNPPVLLSPKTPEMLRELSQSRRVAVISNTGFMNGNEMRGALDTLGIRDSITYEIFSNEVGVNKPHAAIYQRLIDESVTNPERILHIGDNYTADYEGARRLGMHALHVTKVFTAMDAIRPLLNDKDTK